MLHLCNQKLDHVLHTLFNQFIYLGVKLFLCEIKHKITKDISKSGIKEWNIPLPHHINVLVGVFTSWPSSIAHSLADWSLASTITLNMVHKDGEMRKSVDLLLFVSLDSNAILVLKCK